MSIKTSEGDATKTKKSISAPHLTELKSHQNFVEETKSSNCSNANEDGINMNDSLESRLVVSPRRQRANDPVESNCKFRRERDEKLPTTSMNNELGQTARLSPRQASEIITAKNTKNIIKSDNTGLGSTTWLLPRQALTLRHVPSRDTEHNSQIFPTVIEDSQAAYKPPPRETPSTTNASLAIV